MSVLCSLEFSGLRCRYRANRERPNQTSNLLTSSPLMTNLDHPLAIQRQICYPPRSQAAHLWQICSLICFWFSLVKPPRDSRRGGGGMVYGRQHGHEERAESQRCHEWRQRRHHQQQQQHDRRRQEGLSLTVRAAPRLRPACHCSGRLPPRSAGVRERRGRERIERGGIREEGCEDDVWVHMGSPFFIMYVCNWYVGPMVFIIFFGSNCHVGSTLMTRWTKT